ncbi:MAG: Kelch repeat-containing protein [Pseudomonadota bacterium]
MTYAMTRRTALAAAGAALAGPAPAAAIGAPGPWTAKASLPWRVQEIYAAVWKGQIVVAGGLSPDAPGWVQDRTALYDPATDAWREGPRLPAPRHHPNLVAFDDQVFAFGGYAAGDGGLWTARTEIYAFDGTAWREIGRMPGPQGEAVGARLGGHIHLVTGRAPKGEANRLWGDHADVALHRRFDPATGRWSEARPAPQALNSAAGAVIDGRLHLVGGRTVDGGNLGGLHRYDPEADHWQALAPMPWTSGGLAAAAMDGRLFAFGGEWFEGSKAGVYPYVYAYETAANRWREAPRMKTARHGLGGAAVGGLVYAVAGAAGPSGTGTSAILEAFDPAAMTPGA